MNNQPIVSVLIPAYNHEKYIVDCLNSIKIQTYKNIELIICDDGSIDSTPKIIEKWINQNHKHLTRIIFIQQNNHGIVQSINNMIAKSTGELIALCASDDSLTSNSIMDRVSEFNDTKIKIIFGKAKLIDKDNNLISHDAAEYLYGVNYNSKIIKTYSILFFRWALVGPVTMYRRDLLKDINNHYLGEDRQLFLKIKSYKEIKYIDSIVASYRFHTESITRNMGTKRKVLIDVAKVNRDHSCKFTGFRMVFLASYNLDIKLLQGSYKYLYLYYVYLIYKIIRYGLFMPLIIFNFK